MKFMTCRRVLAISLTSALFITAGASTAAASEPTPVEGITVSTTMTHPGAGEVDTEVVDPAGVSGLASVEVDDSVPAAVEVEATTADGDVTFDTFSITDFVATDEENFEATLTSVATGEVSYVNTAAAEQQALPVILVIVARIGIQAALKQFSKVAVQNAAKKYALSLNASKWTHIMAPKHNWKLVGGTNKTKVADLMGRAVANGKAAKARDHIEYTWGYQGRTIVVRTSLGGHVSNGWVK